MKIKSIHIKSNNIGFDSLPQPEYEVEQRLTKLLQVVIWLSRYSFRMWKSLAPFALTMTCGGKDSYDGWMKDPKSAMISCNDGFRPVSFLIEVI